MDPSKNLENSPIFREMIVQFKCPFDDGRLSSHVWYSHHLVHTGHWVGVRRTDTQKLAEQIDTRNRKIYENPWKWPPKC